MDNVLNFIDATLSDYIKTDSTDSKDSFITKTMINNYVKQGIIPPPIHKKYSKLHLAELFVICILKQVYSINDIKNLISLALETSSANVGYNKFCDVLEESINCTFNNSTSLDNKKISKEQYILKNVVQSFANKLYVQIVFLKK